MNLTIYIYVAVGIFVGGLLFSKEFRSKVLSMVFNKNKSAQANPAASGIKYYARDGGWHYHIRSCTMLSGAQFADLGYKDVDAAYILNHHLIPDSCIERRTQREYRRGNGR
jgi:hypothetical protein